MPYATRVVPEHALAVVQLSETIGAPDIPGAVEAYLTDPAWSPSFVVAWDLRRIEHVDLGPEDVRAIAAYIRGHHERMGTGRRAFIVARALDGDLALLLNRMAGRYGTTEMEVFPAAPAAAAWLGVPADVLGPTVRNAPGV
jgi:hypothetical protein